MPPPSPPRNRNDFRIAIICALPLEAGLVESALDTCWENEGQRYGKAVGDDNAYTTGVLGGHNVVLAYMPGMGSTGAAATAASLRTSFPAIELALVVGICGAVPVHPVTREEIVLGDCILSTAVVQYDFGRQYPSGFVQKSNIEDSLGRPSPGIRALISKLTAGLGRQRLAERLGRHLRALQSQIPEAQYPGAGRDRLYESTYVHAHRPPHERCDKCLEHFGTCTKDCTELGCDPGRLVTRVRLTGTTEQHGATKNLPRLHLGRFGSANTVMRSGEDRDRLATVGQLAAFEMEGAGVWSHCPTLVVKSVCDYADSHKNKEWQYYAAASAAACAKAFLEEWPTGDQPSIQDVKSEPIWHVPFSYKDGFIGRTNELQRLQQNLVRQDSDRLAAIVGLGGIGKSRLALELAHQAHVEQTSYSVFWVQATNSSTFEKDIRDIGVKLDIPGIHDDKADVKALVKQRLSDSDRGRWLLIIDNADDEGLWTKQSGLGHPLSLVPYLPMAPHGFVIITTRSRRIAVSLAGRAVIQLQPPPSNEAYDMLRNELDFERMDIIADHSLTSELVEKLARLPLALIQAAAFLNMTQNSISTYLELLDESETEVINLLSEDFGDHFRYPDSKNPVATTWLVSFDHIREHDPLAATFLSSMACLHYKNIPHSLLPEAKSRVEAVKAIGTLTGYSFITKQMKTDTNSEAGDLYDMHRLVYLATRNWLKMEGSFESYIYRSVVRLVQLFPSRDYKYKATWIVYLPHGEHLCLEHATLSYAERYKLMETLAHFLGLEGKYKQAVTMMTEVVKWREAELGLESEDTLDAYTNLGDALNAQGDWVAAEKCLLQADREIRKRYGEEDKRTLTNQAHLASTYWNQGRSQEAEELDVKVLETSTQVLGPDHHDTLVRQANLACTYSNQGRLQEAESLELKVLEARLRLSGPEHPDTLLIKGNLASTYWLQNRFQEAEELEVQVLATESRILGPEHPTTLMSQSNLARTLWMRGQESRAMDLMTYCLDAQRRTLGDRHPDTIYCNGVLRMYQEEIKNKQSRTGLSGLKLH